jgi:hypothetical protein
MEALLSVLVIIAFIVSFSYLQPFSSKGQEEPAQETYSQTKENTVLAQSQEEQTLVEKTGPAALVKPKEPSISINTYITKGPKQGEIIEDKNEVVFRFKASLPEKTEGEISFETKVEGLDKTWQKTHSNERKITFPSYPKEYTFSVRAKIDETPDPTPAKRTFKINVSPYFEKIEISDIELKTSSQPSLITLSTYLEKGEEINITGWQIEGKTRSFVIPKGIEKYNGYSNQIVTDNIIVNQRDTIYLSGAQNPLGEGKNFRPNKCFGYLENYHDFAVNFSGNCPWPEEEDIEDLNICCQEFIFDMRRCEIPYYSENYTVSHDLECLSYLDSHFNYGSCFRNYSKDEDFLEEEWHIYMNKNLLIDYGCDTLYLRDQNGLIVDKYPYGEAICR